MQLAHEWVSMKKNGKDGKSGREFKGRLVATKDGGAEETGQEEIERPLRNEESGRGGGREIV